MNLLGPYTGILSGSIRNQLSPYSVFLGRGLCAKKPSSPPESKGKNMLVTKELLELAATARKGYTGKQIALATKLVGVSRWKRNIVGMDIPDLEWQRFVDYGKGKQKNLKKNSPQIINTVPKKEDGWSWKPKTEDIPTVKIKSKKNKNQGRKKATRQKITRSEDKQFYFSREWRELRARVLEKYECKCMMCGRSPKIHGVEIHVDHIKPRSKYPELSLDFDNLQLLCRCCNLGKGNKFETDWRPNEDFSEELDVIALSNINIKMH